MNQYNQQMIRTAKKFYTQEEYLAFERASLEKHEYYRGEIFDMAGAGFNHIRINKNIMVKVGSFLDNKSCDIFGSDLRVHIPFNTLFTYPDATIVCGRLESYDNEKDIALNPAVIIEILSASTQSYDRGEKFMLYRSIKTLKEYILIDSLSVKVEQYILKQNENWMLKEYTSPAETFTIETIQFDFPLADLYRDVEIV